MYSYTVYHYQHDDINVNDVDWDELPDRIKAEIEKSRQAPKLKPLNVIELTLKRAQRQRAEIDDDLGREIHNLLYKYWIMVADGINVPIESHKRISWRLDRDTDLGRVTIRFKEGRTGQWSDDCDPIQCPAWLQLHLLREIRKHLPVIEGYALAVIRAAEAQQVIDDMEGARNNAQTYAKRSKQRVAKIFGGADGN